MVVLYKLSQKIQVHQHDSSETELTSQIEESIHSNSATDVILAARLEGRRDGQACIITVDALTKRSSSDSNRGNRSLDNNTKQRERLC